MASRTISSVREMQLLRAFRGLLDAADILEGVRHTLGDLGKAGVYPEAFRAVATLDVAEGHVKVERGRLALYLEEQGLIGEPRYENVETAEPSAPGPGGEEEEAP